MRLALIALVLLALTGCAAQRARDEDRQRPHVTVLLCLFAKCDVRRDPPTTMEKPHD